MLLVEKFYCKVCLSPLKTIFFSLFENSDGSPQKSILESRRVLFSISVPKGCAYLMHLYLSFLGEEIKTSV